LEEPIGKGIEKTNGVDEKVSFCGDFFLVAVTDFFFPNAGADVEDVDAPNTKGEVACCGSDVDEGNGSPNTNAGIGNVLEGDE